MVWLALFTGTGGLLFHIRCSNEIDAFSFRAWRAAKTWVLKALAPPLSNEEDLLLLARTISCLRAGISLDSALESFAQETPPGSAQKIRLRGILEGNAPADFLSTFLRSAMDSGTPALSALQGMEKMLAGKRRLALKAHAATGQCRAQAEVLSWLPWAFGLAVALLDRDWFASALHSSLAWFLWAIAVLLSGLGRKWMQSSLSRAFQAKNKTELLEEAWLPDLALRLVAEISQGTDIETAIERSLAKVGNAELTALYSTAKPQETHRIARMKSLLLHAARTGAPIRSDLENFLSDLHMELEARWEERVQRLPIKMLGPLFLCFFPGSLLVLAGLLLPLFLDSL